MKMPTAERLGIADAIERIDFAGGVYPSYAGMNRSHRYEQGTPSRVPHLRGHEPVPAAKASLLTKVIPADAGANGGAKVDHGSGGTVPLRRSKTLPVWELFPVTGRVGGFIPWNCIARSVWRAGTG